MTEPDGRDGKAEGDLPPDADVHSRRSFSVIWLIPLVALAVAGYLGWRGLAERGPTITLTFLTGDGLQGGQTKVEHKAVDLGTVESIDLSPDMSHVVVKVRMRREADSELTDHARFWVVRPHFSVGNISGLETLLSGAFIELDPGLPGGKAQRDFTGLEEPPAVRSDEPGRTFVLNAERIGSLSTGSPVFFHDIPVGELLRYDLGPNGDSIAMHIFVRDPFDKYIHKGTRFWDASGVSVELGNQGVRLQLQSLTAVLSGGIAFDTDVDAQKNPPSAVDTAFPLYKDAASATEANYDERIPFLTYFDSAGGLSEGAAVNFLGLQIGVVTHVGLLFDPNSGSSRVEVKIELQPQRVFASNQFPGLQPLQVAQRLVARGMRAELQTGNLLTGQKVLSLSFVAGAAPAQVTEAGGVPVLPSIGGGGGFADITDGVSQIIAKLNQLPLNQMADNLNGTLKSVNDLVAGPELKQALQSLSGTLQNANDVIAKVNTGTTPLLRRLPEIAQSLQAAVDHANKLIGSADTGYGANSQFNRDLERLLGQVSDTARSVRFLADYLDQHPESLIRGRDNAK